MERKKNNTEELYVVFRGDMARKIQAIVKGWRFKNNGEFFSTAIDVFDKAMKADEKIQVPDSKNQKVLTYGIDQ